MTRLLTRRGRAAALAASLTFLAAFAAHPQTRQDGAMTSPTPIVFFDIAGPDMAAQSSFYAKVFNWQIAPTGQVAVPVTPSPAGLMGTLRAEPKEAMLYMGVEDITATLATIEQHGGKIIAPRFAVPGVVILGLFTDPAGNRMGLVEMKDGKAVVP